jgi:hypothetical protein
VSLNKNANVFPVEDLSLSPFVAYLDDAIKAGERLKADLLSDVRKRLIPYLADDNKFGAWPLVSETLELIGKYSSSESIFPVWPVKMDLLHFPDLLPGRLGECKESLTASLMEPGRDESGFMTELCYAAIWLKYLEIPCPFVRDRVVTLKNDHSGEKCVFDIRVGFKFLNIKTKLSSGHCKKVLDDIDTLSYDPKEMFGLLKERLPLDIFEFEGFRTFHINDITVTHLFSTIEAVIRESASIGMQELLLMLVSALKAIDGCKGMEVGIMPLLKLNGRSTFKDPRLHIDRMLDAMSRPELKAEFFEFLATEYLEKPRKIFHEIIPEYLKEKYTYIRMLSSEGVKSYSLLPVFFHGELIGAMEIYPRDGNTMTKQQVSKFHAAESVIGQYLQRSIETFDTEMESIIKEKFTYLQPSVLWRFNEAAWQYIKQKSAGAGFNEMETIAFPQLYPLYGAVDIRNSTVNRDTALQNDLTIQLKVLLETLLQLKESIGFALLDEKIAECNAWKELIGSSSDIFEEEELNDFLENDISFLFKQLAATRPGVKPLINNYLHAQDEVTGLATESRRNLELSMTSVINVINEEVDNIRELAQAEFPCFFDKFKTDGVEYDFYIGQSLSPQQPFSPIFIQSLRLRQLHSMATIAKRVKALHPHLPVKVETTQLIFVHPHCVDISFRTDERRFDVEGAYNIRYEVVKKRIDKVCIKGTDLRLTVPDKIALVYFNQKEIDEFIRHFNFLQKQAILEQEIEWLDLEPLQGVMGLKAVRVTVKY